MSHFEQDWVRTSGHPATGEIFNPGQLAGKNARGAYTPGYPRAVDMLGGLAEGRGFGSLDMQLAADAVVWGQEPPFDPQRVRAVIDRLAPPSGEARTEQLMGRVLREGGVVASVVINGPALHEAVAAKGDATPRPPLSDGAMDAAIRTLALALPGILAAEAQEAEDQTRRLPERSNMDGPRGSGGEYQSEIPLQNWGHHESFWYDGDVWPGTPGHTLLGYAMQDPYDQRTEPGSRGMIMSSRLHRLPTEGEII